MNLAPRAAATAIVRRIASSDDAAAAELLPMVYDQLRRLATGYLRRSPLSLQPTELVHEAYVQMVDRAVAGYSSRAHFLGVAATAMRQVVVDHNRRRGARKRGQGWQRIALDEAVTPCGASEFDVLALHHALQKLSEKGERLTRVVELRFFGGATIEETAVALGVSHTTVEKDWALAKAWLSRELSAGGELGR